VAHAFTLKRLKRVNFHKQIYIILKSAAQTHLLTFTLAAKSLPTTTAVIQPGALT
jgi:hypothetical protein